MRSVPAEARVPAAERLLTVRSQFIERVSEPVLNQRLDKLLQQRVINDQEMESMADPGSQPPAETSSPPPARSSDAGLRDFDPSLDPEVQEGEGEQDLLPDLERPERKKDGADRALNKPPELHLHKGVTGEGHRRIGGQNLRAISHMTPAAAASPTTGPSVSGKRTMLLSNEARREFSLIHEFFAANGSKKLIFFYQDVKQSLSSRQSSSVDASNSAVAQRKLFLTTGNSEVIKVSEQTLDD
ncbi:unnamed protein product [Oreochromis niloticus]|nr:unnamed protein product [Mustela putorius furo]